MHAVAQLDLAGLEAQETVILLIALGGLIPVILCYRSARPWVVVAYGFLLVGAIATNLENLVWYDGLNAIEHFLGNLGAGVAFAVIAYANRVSADGEEGQERFGSETDGP